MQRASLERFRTVGTWRAHLRTHSGLALCQCELQPGRFRKGQRLGGCGKARCFLCHYSKLLGLATLSERRGLASFKEGLAELTGSNPQVELTAKQRSRCLVPVMRRMSAAAHLQR